MRKQQIGWKRETDSARQQGKEREREREKRTNQVSRSQIGKSSVDSVASRISCRRRRPPAPTLVTLTFDRVTHSLIFNLDCVSNGLARSWLPVTSYRWKCLACCAHQRLLFQHIHKFLLCKDLSPGSAHYFIAPPPACLSCLPISVSGANFDFYT